MRHKCIPEQSFFFDLRDGHLLVAQPELLQPENPTASATKLPDLERLFHVLNQVYFQGEIPPLPIVWNQRLRSTAGRFCAPPPVIQVGVRYHQRHPAELEDTLKHEMVHAWLFARRRPFGHTSEFRAKLAEIGGSRYARYDPMLVRRRSRQRFLYQCPACRTLYVYLRRIRNHSCGRCARSYDPRYRLESVGILADA